MHFYVAVCGKCCHVDCKKFLNDTGCERSRSGVTDHCISDKPLV